MKKILVLGFSSLPSSSLAPDLLEEFSQSIVFRGENLALCNLMKEVDQFDLPVGSVCFLQYDQDSNDASFAFRVSKYAAEINRNFSEWKIFVYLEFSNFVGFDPKKIVNYLETEWSI